MKLRLTDLSVILSLTTRSSCCVSCGWLIIIIMIRPAVPEVANHNHINLWSIQCQWGLIWVSCCRVISREWEAGTHKFNPHITWQICVITLIMKRITWTIAYLSVNHWQTGSCQFLIQSQQLSLHKLSNHMIIMRHLNVLRTVKLLFHSLNPQTEPDGWG